MNIILQDHFLFTGTVRENVDPTNFYSDERVKNALQQCGIWEEMEKREGLGTEITEGGNNLSSGEKQLINIARSLLSPKRIVLIDEATASIDPETDKMIQKVMKEVFSKQTVLTIAHRIHTVIGSDRILVMEKGTIAEFDTPANLLRRKNSLFAKLYH
jgi:ABC-type multidrug transport system fused ATPase/permease subunit